MTVNPKPNGPRLLVKPLDANETNHNGIVLPVEVKDKERRGIVHAVGDGWYREPTEDGMTMTPLSFSPGDVIVYGRGSGVHVTLDLAENGVGEDFVVLLVQDVLLTLEDVPGTDSDALFLAQERSDPRDDA